MKKNTNFLDRLRIALRYIFKPHSKSGIVTQCSLCDSFNVRLISRGDKQELKHMESYSLLECLHCGGYATCNEKWFSGRVYES